ncbi:HAD family hydrolase [Catellatospora sp. TT07R-123]|uniref:HAD family hydrolase n=1 Tax=Catellatospora sp. TT07R-123 TaxID=2733863 RepID=UPI001BB3749A|nr:HAD family hydrolase [Catellatospora sp. TT07R-123]
MQRLALFDLDNTLVDRDEAFHRWAAGFCDDHGLPPAACAWLVSIDGGGFVPRDRFFGEVRGRFGLAASVDHLWADYRQQMPELVSCRPAVLDMLTGLRRQGWRMAIVTNGRADGQLGKIRRTGLDRHVDAWAVSGELGIRKPARELFEAAARGCGLELADGGWAVGDSPTLDVEGGRGAGLATVWISRGMTWPPELSPPDQVCGAVEEVEGVLSGGRPGGMPVG